MVDAPQIDELKELVKVSLQQTGVLSSIKAQLRAAVFKVVNDEQSLKASNPPPAVMNTSEGALAADLVREFLEFYKLHSSLAVLIPEAGLDQDYPGRHPLAARLGVPDDPGCPLLVRLLSAHTSNPGAPQTQKTPAPTTKPGSGPPAAAPSMPEEEEPEAEEEATPPPTQGESRAARNEGSRLGGSPESPGDDPPASMHTSERDSGGAGGGGLGTLAGLPSLGRGKGGGLGTLAGLPSLGRGGGGGGFGALAADEDEDDEDDDDELTSTTRRVKLAEGGGGGAGAGAGGGEDASEASPASSGGVDKSLEERQNRMLESAAKAEIAMKNRGADLAIELSDNDISDDDIVEEEIEVESDMDGEEAPSPQWGGASKTEGLSLSESCTEVSVSDRSVDGSMALEAFDHIEVVSH